MDTNLCDQMQWEQEWRENIKAAKLRPAMFVGGTATAHKYALSEPLRLVWEAKAFRRPQSASILLSPHQYVLRCFTGPLVRPIQKMFSWEGKRILPEGWFEAMRPLSDAWVDSILQDLPRLRGWRKSFGCSTGPRLDSPMYAFLLARRFIIGYRVDDGMWCQTFESGWPQTVPFLVKEPSPVGLLVAAELEKEWFQDLPFSESDAQLPPSRSYANVEWHTQDDLIGADSLTWEGVSQLLCPHQRN